MNLNFKNWINEQISTADLQKAVSGIITQITTTGTQGTNNSNNNTEKIMTAVKKTGQQVADQETNYKQDLKNKTDLIIKVLTGNNRPVNPNQKPDSASEEMANNVAIKVVKWLDANKKDAERNAATPTGPTAQTNIKPPKAR